MKTPDNPDLGHLRRQAKDLLAGLRDGNPQVTLAGAQADSFRGAATGLLNYVAGQVDVALNAQGEQDERYADRNMRHLLTHLPSRTTYEQVLAAALTEPEARSVGA